MSRGQCETCGKDFRVDMRCLPCRNDAENRALFAEGEARQMLETERSNLKSCWERIGQLTAERDELRRQYENANEVIRQSRGL